MAVLMVQNRHQTNLYGHKHTKNVQVLRRTGKSGCDLCPAEQLHALFTVYNLHRMEQISYTSAESLFMLTRLSQTRKVNVLQCVLVPLL